MSRRLGLGTQDGTTRVAVLGAMVLVALLSIAWTGLPQGAGGTVVGEVTNGTPDGGPLVDLPVTLHVFSGMEETDVYTTAVGTGQEFRFEDVALEEGQTLVTRTEYEDVAYFSEFVTVEGEQDEVSLPITVYETTSDDSGVAVAQLHIFLDRTGETLEVSEYCVIANGGSRTYVGSLGPESGAPTTWSVGLPDGAQNLSFDTGQLGGRFVAAGDGFADTRAISPGNAAAEASFSYELPYSAGLRVEQVFDVPVNAVVVVLRGEDLALEGPGLASQGTLETQMGPALSYTAGPLAPGEPLAFELVSGGTGSGTGGAVQGNGLTVGLGTLALAAGAAYWLWEAPARGSMPPEARWEVEAIAALDGDFERGNVSEKAYRKKRRELKRTIRDVLTG